MVNPKNMTKRLLYLLLALAFVIGFAVGLWYENTEDFQSRFNIRGTKTTETTTTQATGPDMGS